MAIKPATSKSALVKSTVYELGDKTDRTGLGYDTSMNNRSLPLSIALVACTVIAATSWSVVKLSRPTTIDVRGSARRRINSDLAQWTVAVSAVKPARVAAYSSLTKDVEQVLAFLRQAGLPDASVRASAVELTELSHEQVVTEGNKERRLTVFDGWQAAQHIDVGSDNVALVERLSREATQLLEKGLVISSESPRYLFTKVGELKIEMLAEASRDARQRAERMIEAAGGGARVGRVEGIDTGVININAANSTETSWEGNYDTSSFEKDILTTVRVRFEVKN